MKESIFNTKVTLENKVILYNTLSRKYHIYAENDSDIDYVMNNLSISSYSLNQLEILKDFISKKIIIKDDIDEIEKIRFLEKSHLFQEKMYYLTIQPTLNCNFRCTYCYEKHLETTIDESTEVKILKFVENKTKSLKKLNVIWFGGEPMMRFDAMKRLSESIKEICDKNHCEFVETLVTNGYLFDDNIINELKNFNIKSIQITIDGNKLSHNKQRPLLDGSETYDTVVNNMIKLVNSGFKIIFRINVSKDNYDDISDALDIIPINKRDKVTISMCNLFQTEKKLSLFNLYKLAIEKGYTYEDTYPSIATCNYACKNALTIEPNGKCSICSCMSEFGLKAGYINDNGSFIMENESEYLKIKNLLTTDRQMCRKCKKLPMCMGGCSYARYKDNNFCDGNGSEGLSIDQRIVLHYLYDLQSMRKTV